MRKKRTPDIPINNAANPERAAERIREGNPGVTAAETEREAGGEFRGQPERPFRKGIIRKHKSPKRSAKR